MAIPTFKSFVTEKEVEEVRKKRQEEWERVRKPSDPLERPETAVDNRTLYERLKEQRDRKQEEWDEQFKFKNMIYKGLDDEESGFLTFVAQRKAEQEADVIRNEIKEVVAYREAVSKLHDEVETAPTPREVSEGGDEDKGKTAMGGKKSKPKSQLALIAGSIKTKRKRTSSEVSDSKESAGDGQSETTPNKKAKLLDVQPSAEKTAAPTVTVSTTDGGSGSQAQSTLSGLLAAYSSSSDSDEGD